MTLSPRGAAAPLGHPGPDGCPGVAPGAVPAVRRRRAPRRGDPAVRTDLVVGVVFGLLAASNLVQGVWLAALPWLDLTTLGFALALPIALTGLLRPTSVQQVGVMLLLLGALVLGYLEPPLSTGAADKRTNLVLGVAFVFVASYVSLSNPRRVRAFLVTVTALALPVIVGQALLPDTLAMATGRRTPVGVNAIGAGRELGSALVLVLAFLASARRRHRAPLVLVAVVLGAGLYLAGSRGPILGVLVAVVVLVVRHPTLRRQAKMTLLAALALGGALAYSRSELTSSRLTDITTSGRQEIYGGALRVAAEQPLGIGWGNFARFAPAAQLNTSQGDNLYVHNIVLEFWVEAGVAAALAFCVFLVAVVVLARRSTSRSPVDYALAALVANLLTGAMLSSDVIGNRLLWVALAAVLAGAASRDAAPRRPRASSRARRRAARLRDRPR